MQYDSGQQRKDGQKCYQPNRVLVLILDDLDEEVISQPITSLLTETAMQVVSDFIIMLKGVLSLYFRKSV